MRLLGRAGSGSPACRGGVAAAGTVDKFVHRAEMDGPIGDPIFQGIVPTRVLGVSPAGHRAVISDIGKVIGAPGRIVLEHRIGTERALTAEGQRAENLGRYTGIEFVIERLTRARRHRSACSWTWAGRCW